ncbi:hypothetical protein MKX01_013495 [Papaver californicum]|nr:hypothetical protein MKX01_039969 [Papaver californicum]KAI3975581.1 hypothetical protein MKX01_013495 [Papaver californicum]
MDWGICGQLYSQEGKKYMEDGLKCIDYIDHWPDVIEEDAVNEKYCKKVLRKLIKKADHELEELEGDLFILQTQQEWADKNKYDEWFDTCFKGLQENIQRLGLSICGLKDVRHGDIGDGHSKVLREPVRRVHEVIKALLSKELQNKHEQMGQPADSISEEVRSDQQPAGIFSEDLRLSELPADILSRDLRSDEQPTKIISENLRMNTLSHSSGPSDSTTVETEKAKSKFTYFTESSLCLKPNSDVSAAVNIQDFGDTVTSGTTSIILFPMVPGHMDENAIQPLKFMALSSIPSLELQQRQEMNKTKSEPSVISSKSSFILSNPSINSKGEVPLKPKIIAQSNPSGTQKSSPTATENRMRSTPEWMKYATVSHGHNSTGDMSSSNSPLMLQKQMDKHVMQLNTSEPLTSVTFEPIQVLPSSAMQRKVRIKSEIHVVEEPKSITGVLVHRNSSFNSQRKISQSVESKAQLFLLGTEKSGAALTGSMINSASSSKSRGTQKRKQDQEKHKSRIIQKDGERVKMPMVASNESLSLPEPTTYDGLNKVTIKQLQKHGISLGLRGCKDCRKEALIHKILEAKKLDAQLCTGTSISR